MPLSLADEADVFTHYVNKPLGPTNQTPEAQTRRHAGHASGVIENSRIETVLPKHGPTEGADSMRDQPVDQILGHASC